MSGGDEIESRCGLGFSSTIGMVWVRRKQEATREQRTQEVRGAFESHVSLFSGSQYGVAAATWILVSSFIGEERSPDREHRSEMKITLEDYLCWMRFSGNELCRRLIRR